MQEKFNELLKRKIREAEEMKTIRGEIRKLELESTTKLTPDITDISVLSKVYDLCNDLQKDGEDHRKETLFVIMMIFAPNVILLRDRVPARFRKELARVCRCHPSSISIDVHNLMLLYNQYRGFRDVVQGLYAKVRIALNG